MNGASPKPLTYFHVLNSENSTFENLKCNNNMKKIPSKETYLSFKLKYIPLFSSGHG